MTSQTPHPAPPAASSREHSQPIGDLSVLMAALVLIAVATALTVSWLRATLHLLMLPVADAIGSVHAPREILPTAVYALLAALMLGRRLDRTAPARTAPAQRRRLMVLAGVAARCATALAEQIGHIDEIVVRSTPLTLASAAVATLLGVVAGACVLAARNRPLWRRHGLPMAAGFGALGGGATWLRLPKWPTGRLRRLRGPGGRS